MFSIMKSALFFFTLMISNVSNIKCAVSDQHQSGESQDHVICDSGIDRQAAGERRSEGRNTRSLADKPIRGLHIEYNGLPIVNRIMTLMVNVAEGTNVQFKFKPLNDLSFVTERHENTAYIYGLASTVALVVEVIAWNDVGQQNATFTINLQEPLSYFVVKPSASILRVGGTVQFDIVARGAYNVTFLILNDQEDTTILHLDPSTTRTSFSKTYTKVGEFSTIVMVGVGNVTEFACSNFSDVPCTLSADISVQKDLHHSMIEVSSSVSSQFYAFEGFLQMKRNSIITQKVKNGGNVFHKVVLDNAVVVNSTLGAYDGTTSKYSFLFSPNVSRHHAFRFTAHNNISEVHTLKYYYVYNPDHRGGLLSRYPTVEGETVGVLLANGFPASDYSRNKFYLDIGRFEFKIPYYLYQVNTAGYKEIIVRSFNKYGIEYSMKWFAFVIGHVGIVTMTCDGNIKRVGQNLSIDYSIGNYNYVYTDLRLGNGTIIKLGPRIGRFTYFYTSAGKYKVEMNVIQAGGKMHTASCDIRVFDPIENASVVQKTRDQTSCIQGKAIYLVRVSSGTEVSCVLNVFSRSKKESFTAVMVEKECRLSYQFLIDGNYTININIFNAVSNVQFPSSIYHVKKLPYPLPMNKLLISFHPEGNYMSYRHALNFSGYIDCPFKLCELAYTDGTLEKHEMVPSGVKFRHQYVNNATIAVSIKCFNLHNGIAIIKELEYIDFKVNGDIYSLEPGKTVCLKGLITGPANDTWTVTLGGQPTPAVIIKNGLQREIRFQPDTKIATSDVHLQVSVHGMYTTIVVVNKTVSVLRNISVLSFLSPTFAEANQPMEFSIIKDDGFFVSLRFNFGDGNITQYNMSNELGVWETFPHVYKLPGTFYVSADFQNSLSRHTINRTVTVLSTLVEFTIEKYIDTVWPERSVVFLLQKKSSPLPSEPLLFHISYGDGYQLEWRTLPVVSDTKSIDLGEHVYSQAGCYDVDISVKNQRRQIKLYTTVRVKRDLVIETITFSNYGVLGQAVIRNGIAYLKSEYPVQVDVKSHFIGCIVYTWTLLSSPEVSYKSSNGSVIFSSNITDQIITLRINVTNLVNTMIIERKFVTQNSIRRFILISKDNEIHGFTVSYIGLLIGSKNMTANIMFGDAKGHHRLVNPSPITTSSLKYLENYPEKELEELSIYSAFEFNHTFDGLGVHVTKVTLSNLVSSIEASRDVYISNDNRPCSRPNVNIFNGTLFETRLVFQVGQEISISPSVILNCAKTATLKFAWELYSTTLDDVLSGAIALPERRLDFPEDVSTERRSLLIKKRDLAAGEYIARITASLVEVGLSASDAVYIVLKAIPLVVRIIGGSYREWPLQEPFYLDASESYNPNGEEDSLLYSWDCRDSRGTPCLHEGQKMTLATTSRIQVPTKSLKPNEIYTFFLNVSTSSTSQRGHSFQRVLFQAAQIPAVEIRCSSNCGEVLPNKRLSLVGNCSFCCQDSVFTWTFLNSDGTEVVLSWLEQTLTKQNSVSFVLEKNNLNYSRTYISELHVRGCSGLVGKTKYEFTTLKLASPGECTIQPLVGYALQTLFSISCNGYQNFSTTPTFEFSLEANRNTDKSDQNIESTKLLGSQIVPSLTTMLPMGAKEQNYTQSIKVELKRADGLSTSLKINAQVIPVDSDKDAPEENLNILLSDSNSGLGYLKETGDSQALGRLVQVASTSLQDINTTSQVNEAEAEEKKILRSQIREKLSDALDSIPVSNLASCEQVASSLETLTLTSEGTNEKTEKNLLSVAGKVSTFLDRSTENNNEIDSKRITSGVSQVLSGVGTILSSLTNRVEKSKGTQETKTDSKATEKYETQTKEATAVVSSLSSLLLKVKAPGEVPTRVETKELALEVEKDLVTSFKKESVKTLKGGDIRVPSGKAFLSKAESERDTLSREIIVLSKNPYILDSDGTGSNLGSTVTKLSFALGKKKITLQKLTADDQIRISINTEYNANRNKTFFSMSTTETRRQRIFSLAQPCFLLTDMKVLESDSSCVLVASHTVTPKSTKSPYTVNITLGNSSETANHLKLGPIEDTGHVSTSYFAHPYNCSSRKINFTSIWYFSTCVYLNEATRLWKTEGCTVSDETKINLTVCLCNHTTWFGGGVLAKPNTINIEEQLLKLKNIADYPALLATFLTILCTYIVSMVWARRMDKADAFKASPIIAIQTQDGEAKAKHMVTFYTGHRPGSGTTATIAIVLGGDLGSTRPILLHHPQKNMFNTRSVDTFIVHGPKDLGTIRYIHIWHDNKGEDPAWFLGRVTVTDMRSEKRTYFLCNDWLAVDRGSGVIEKLIAAATELELKSFESIFLQRTAGDFSDSHLWFSVFTRPAHSNFTRVQRVSSCLSILLSTMLANVLFYRDPTTIKVGNEVEMGPFKFTWRQIIVGIEASLIVFPINLLIVQIFRKAKPCSDCLLCCTSYWWKTTAKISPEKEEIKSDTEVAQLKEDKPTPIPRKEVYAKAFTIESNLGNGQDSLPSIFKGFEKVSSDTMKFNNCQPNHCHSGNRLPSSQSNADSIGSKWEANFESIHLIHPKNDQINKEVAKEPILLPCKESHEVTEHTNKGGHFVETVKLDTDESWPSWCNCVAWFFCLTSSAVAGFFTLLYGISFPKRMQEEWLVSMFTSLFGDIFINQPIKIVVIATVFALILKKFQETLKVKSDVDHEDVSALVIKFDDAELNHDEADEDDDQLCRAVLLRPPSPDFVKKARDKRLHEMKMTSVLVEIGSYLFYLWLVLMIAYGHRDPDAYKMTKDMEDTFVNDKFENVYDATSFWSWAKEELVPGLYGETWYNNRPVGVKRLMGDYSTYLIGASRLRQIRGQKVSSCPAAGKYNQTLLPCMNTEEYKEEEQEVFKGHFQYNQSTLPNYLQNSWEYQSSSTLDGQYFVGKLSSYSGGGYVQNLGASGTEASTILEHLKSTRWIDRFTKAVFVEFTVYNNNENFFCVLWLVAEFTPNGGAFPFHRILTSRLDRYSTGFSIMIGACEVSVALFTLFHMYTEIKRIRKIGRTYFSDFRNIVDIAVFGLTWTTMALLIVRLGIVAWIKDKYKRNPNEFTNFQYAATSDLFYGYILATFVALAIVKSLKLLRFNKNMSLLLKTVKYSIRDLKHFSVSFTLAYLAFVNVGYLLFGPVLFGYSNYVRSMESLLDVLLGAFDYYDFEEGHRLLGPPFFVCYVTVMTVILINIFLTIMMDAFSLVKGQLVHEKNKYEILEFLVGKFLDFLPCKVTKFQGNPITESKIFGSNHENESMKEADAQGADTLLHDAKMSRSELGQQETVLSGQIQDADQEKTKCKRKKITPKMKRKLKAKITRLEKVLNDLLQRITTIDEYVEGELFEEVLSIKRYEQLYESWQK